VPIREAQTTTPYVRREVSREGATLAGTGSSRRSQPCSTRRKQKVRRHHEETAERKPVFLETAASKRNPCANFGGDPPRDGFLHASRLTNAVPVKGDVADSHTLPPVVERHRTEPDLELHDPVTELQKDSNASLVCG